MDIQEIFKTQLKIEAKVMAIETLFANERRTRKTNYQPAYQRNYVWDDDKATYFIESILLGTEIPPIIFFVSEEKIEVIDGRQRYETIKRFIDKKLKLKKKGLLKLIDLRNKNFDDLDELKDIFWDTKLRIIEFSFRDISLASPEKEDLIKMEIFKRYNSGITPLRAVEIDKAKYQDNQVNAYFKNRINKSVKIQKLISEILTFEIPFDIEKVLRKIRQQIVLPYIPIKYYSSTNIKQQVLSRFFENLSNTIVDIEGIYIGFVEKLETLKIIKNYFESLNLPTNKLVYECFFWGLSIIEKEGKSTKILLEDSSKSLIYDWIKANLPSYSLDDSSFYKQIINRYEITAQIFSKIFDVDFDIYTQSNQVFKEENKRLSQITTDNDIYSVFNSLRLNKPDASSNTIEDISNRMRNERFLVRPAYQRKEVIDRYKSSAIIESILLSIKIPPIFLYKRNDGVAEVLDGQQRLLSILGFLGRNFIDENKRSVYSEKNNYTLRKLNILKDVEGKKFNELPTHYQDRILDFDLWIIEISERTNPKFDPIDLFIRLNYKPFPILENTFEMWNSYVDREIIDQIKKLCDKYKDWFFVKVDNRRMETESLLTYLSFLEFQTKTINDRREPPSNFDIYKSSSKLNIRITSKSEITQKLDNPANKTEFLESCKNLEQNFIIKLKLLISDEENDSELLKNELAKILDISKIRTFQSFYAIWYMLLNIHTSVLMRNKLSLRAELTALMKDMRTQTDVYKFKDNVRNIQEKYK